MTETSMFLAGLVVGWLSMGLGLAMLKIRTLRKQISFLTPTSQETIEH